MEPTHVDRVRQHECRRLVHARPFQETLLGYVAYGDDKINFADEAIEKHPAPWLPGFDTVDYQDERSPQETAGHPRDGKKVNVPANDDAEIPILQQPTRHADNISNLAVGTAGDPVHFRGYLACRCGYETREYDSLSELGVPGTGGQEVAIELRDSAAPPKRVGHENKRAHVVNFISIARSRIFSVRRGIYWKGNVILSGSAFLVRTYAVDYENNADGSNQAKQ
jgi:hypothetical protein